MENKCSEEIMRLFTVRKKLEEEISELNAILKANKNVGMHESLVDNEGYPRNDIDVYQVTHSRATLIRIQNDYKALMKNCEDLLFKYHSGDHLEFKDKSGRPPSLSNNVTRKLAVVGKVAPGSPSDMAGLKEGDFILEFGNINSSNMNDLQDLSREVEQSFNMYIKVIVQRDNKLKRLNLKPKTWQGNGLLGCLFKPH